MRPFDDLTPRERQLLAEEVGRLIRLGLRDQFVNMLQEAAEEIVDSEVDTFVQQRMELSSGILIPAIGPADNGSLARGRELYVQQGCPSCHGEHGRGVKELSLFDESRRPTRPRDLVSEPYRGGREPESVYLRILLGMPGTPHPASSDLSEAQLIDLVHYCLSLFQGPERVLTNYQREMLATCRAYMEAFD
jgi:mono/diheme cytochrome c family protein